MNDKGWAPTEPILSNEYPTFDFVVGRSVKCRVLERINHGSYGMIHKGILLETDEKVIVKLENQKIFNQQLLREANIVRQLVECPGIAKVFWYGIMDPYYNVMVMQELGPSLQQLFSYCDHKFTLDTVVSLACQIFDILHYIHNVNIVHRDIKPDNFLMGHSDPERVYLIDFGLSNTYDKCRALRRTSSLSFQKSLVGTSRYASLHAHRCELPAPRDDLESLGYCFVYFLSGSLPWQHMHLGNDITRDNHNLAIQKMKTEITMDDLCEGICPAFKGYIDFTRLLKFGEVINYERLKRKFLSLSSSSEIVKFDWIRKHEITGNPIVSHGDRGHNASSDK